MIVRLNGNGEFGRLGDQLGNFKKALLDAFPTVASLDEMLLVYLKRQRQAIALGDNLNEVVFKVIGNAEDNSWTAELLAAARTASPSNDALLTFSQPFGLAPATPVRSQLEKKIKQANGTLDPALWRARLGTIEGQVCKLEVYGTPVEYGTGFLVGPDVVMTNYHVVESVITKQVEPEKVALRFDYKRLAGGATLQAGTVYTLATEDDWLIDESPYSPFDVKDKPGSPKTDELDYVLLRVKGAPGDDPVGGPAVNLVTPQPRGWVEIPPQAKFKAHDFKNFPSVFILQHPGDGPMKLAMDTDSVIGLNDNETRVRHTTTTEPGSSGSPCFDGDWNLIALHHAGDPSYEKFLKATYNQAIPLAAIVSLLEARKKRDVLGKQSP